MISLCFDIKFNSDHTFQMLNINIIIEISRFHSKYLNKFLIRLFFLYIYKLLFVRMIVKNQKFDLLFNNILTAKINFSTFYNHFKEERESSHILLNFSKKNKNFLYLRIFNIIVCVCVIVGFFPFVVLQLKIFMN